MTDFERTFLLNAFAKDVERRKRDGRIITRHVLAKTALDRLCLEQQVMIGVPWIEAVELAKAWMNATGTTNDL